MQNRTVQMVQVLGVGNKGIVPKRVRGYLIPEEG